jgi:hypothetical protein
MHRCSSRRRGSGAREQDAYWPYHDVLLQSKDLGRAARRHAQRLGLGVARLVACLTPAARAPSQPMRMHAGSG